MTVVYCKFWAALGCFLLALPLAAAQPGIKMQFVGGTVSGIASKTNARLNLTGSNTLSFHWDNTELAIAYQKVNTVEYGQNVSRRYAAAVLISPILLLSKARRHYVTIGYVDEEGKQQALIFRVEKGDIRSVLASLEARTGRRIEYQDNEARKAGKG